jgi:prefoldin subunit 4
MSLNVGGTADADVEVRLEDQNAINEFGRLNNRVVEIRAEIKQAKEDSEKMDDAVVDLSMAEGKVMLFMGETFFETTEEYATEYCESKMEVSC